LERIKESNYGHQLITEAPAVESPDAAINLHVQSLLFKKKIQPANSPKLQPNIVTLTIGGQ
jgi:hypothetical protein